MYELGGIEPLGSTKAVGRPAQKKVIIQWTVDTHADNARIKNQTESTDEDDGNKADFSH